MPVDSENGIWAHVRRSVFASGLISIHPHGYPDFFVFECGNLSYHYQAITILIISFVENQNGVEIVKLKW